MPKYTKYGMINDDKPEKPKVHPIWRGIGCILLVVNPVISYVAADYFITNKETYTWVIIPEKLIVNSLPDPLLLVKIFYTAIIVAVLYSLLTIITFLLNSFFGKSKYGPYDIPLDKVQRK
jgi:hypothetical protein